jgi:predicted nucleotidyltransferase
MKNDNSTKINNTSKPMLANRLFIDGNLLKEKDNKVFYKIYEEFAEPLVWQIGLGYWGTLKRFKKVIKERKIELEVLRNLFDNPELLQTTS